MTQENPEVTQDDEFDNAWNESEEQSSEELPEQQEEPEQPSEPETPEQPEEEKPSDVDQVKQELKSWQGRSRKAKEEFEALQAELEALREQAEQAKIQEQEETVTDDYSDQLSEFAEITTPILDRVQRDIDSRIKPLEQQQEALKAQTQESLERTAQEQHLSVIRQAHSDFEQIVSPDDSGKSKLESWVDSLPYGEAVQYVNTMQQGTAQEVVEMLSAFKNAQSPQDQRRSQMDAAATIPRGQTAQKKAALKKDDFDGTWDSIT